MLALPLQVSITGREIVADRLRKAEPSVLTQSGPRSTNINNEREESTPEETLLATCLSKLRLPGPSSFINYI